MHKGSLSKRQLYLKIRRAIEIGQGSGGKLASTKAVELLILAVCNGLTMEYR
jgi:hypothetical protein